MSPAGSTRHPGRRGSLGWWGLVPVAACRWPSCGGRRSARRSASREFISTACPRWRDFLARMMPPNFAFMEKLWKPAVEKPAGRASGAPSSASSWRCRSASSPRAISRRILRCIHVTAPGAERDARHQRDHPRADLRRRDRARPVRRRAGARDPRRRHARQVLRRGDRGDRRGPARRVQVGRRRHPSRRIVFGVLPQVLPTWIGDVFYRLETNVRVSRPCSAWWAPAASASSWSLA